MKHYITIERERKRERERPKNDKTSKLENTPPSNPPIPSLLSPHPKSSQQFF
jgi:hypothetical protein